MTLTKTFALIRVLLGARPAWLPQNRDARRVGWGEAARMLWPHTLAGLVAFAALASVSWSAVAIAAPFAGGLLVAVPLAVVSAAPGPSDWLRAHQVAATPEELPHATVSPRRRIHILYGDRTGGGHSARAAQPDKSAFPASWSDDDIIAAIESVANDPRARRTEQPNGRTRVEGTRRGVLIRVIVGEDGTSIITGYPLRQRH
jgi:membrane glycosyltransferase